MSRRLAHVSWANAVIPELPAQLSVRHPAIAAIAIRRKLVQRHEVHDLGEQRLADGYGDPRDGDTPGSIATTGGHVRRHQAKSLITPCREDLSPEFVALTGHY
ncbi:MAG: hypothetical protein IPN24_04320 [Betaproteobacteria bacterium]|nr:hypothetical protein [Betaproteobacteria bacterium]